MLLSCARNTRMNILATRKKKKVVIYHVTVSSFVVFYCTYHFHQLFDYESFISCCLCFLAEI